MSRTKTTAKASRTEKAVTDARTALVAAEAQLTTYSKALREAQADLAAAERSLSQGDEGTSGADLIRHRGEIERLELLQSSAAAALRSAKKAENLAHTDVYTEVVADVIRESLRGRIEVVHLAPGEKVPEVSERSLLVQTDSRDGVFDLVDGTVKLTVTFTSASIGLDEDLTRHLPGAKRSQKQLVNVVGEAGSIISVEYKQRRDHQRADMFLHSVNTMVVVAAAVPELQGPPPSFRFSWLAQGIRGLLRTKRTGWGSTREVDAWELGSVKPSVKVDDDGTTTTTFTATIPVPLGHSEDKAWTERTVQTRLAEYEGRHIPGIGRVVSVEVGQPKVSAVMNNGVPTNRLVAVFPLNIEFVAKLAQQDDEDDD